MSSDTVIERGLYCPECKKSTVEKLKSGGNEAFDYLKCTTCPYTTLA